MIHRTWILTAALAAGCAAETPVADAPQPIVAERYLDDTRPAPASPPPLEAQLRDLDPRGLVKSKPPAVVPAAAAAAVEVDAALAERQQTYLAAFEAWSRDHKAASEAAHEQARSQLKSRIVEGEDAP